MKNQDKWCIEKIALDGNGKQQAESGSKFISFFKRNYKKILIITLVVYLLILAYGVTMTRFYIDESGHRHVFKMSFSDIKLEDDYDSLTDKLDDIRELLTDITVVDIHLANGDISNYEAATQYNNILNSKLDILIPKIDAMNVQNGQETVKNELKSILSNDLALYLQYIIKGLQTGSNDTVSAALSYRDKALTTYDIIENDIRNIADALKIQASDYFSWNLGDAVLKKDKTAILQGNGES